MRDLTIGNEGKLILQFAAPMLLGNVFQQLFSVVDAIAVLREKDWDLLLFPNVRTGKVCCVHLRPDGNFGLVEAE